MSVIFLFIDGVGLGKRSDSNPFAMDTYHSFTRMADGGFFGEKCKPVAKHNHLFKGIDANLNVDGLPQSGTGQTALFTGVNASKMVGRHFGPFPHSEIKPLLKEDSIFKKAKENNKECMFLNAYPDIFFKKAEQRDRWSCTTLMAKSAGLNLHTAEDVKKGRAVTAGITQEAWRKELGIDVPIIEPEIAASRLLERARESDLLLYEYYLTDKAGHSRSFDKARTVLSKFDAFLMELINKKEARDTVVLSSDHGNVEDLSTKTHTRNNVPLFVYGPGAQYFNSVESILDVTPAILEIL